MDEFEKAQRILSPAGGIPITLEALQAQSDQILAFQSEKPTYSQHFPETMYILSKRIEALLAKDGLNEDGVILLRAETLEELRVLTALIHELR